MKKYNFLNKSLCYIFFLVFFGLLYFVYEEPKESVFLVLSSITATLIIRNRDRLLSNKKFITILIYIILSYIISIAFIFSRGYKMELYLNGLEQKNKGKAVMLVYEGEAEKYNLKKSIANIKEDRNLKDIILSPFILWSKKRYYNELGKSDYKENTLKVKNQLQDLLSDEFKVYLSYIYDTTYVEEALIQIVNDGYRDVIICPVILSDGQNLSILKSRIEKMKLFKLNITVKYTESLWDSETIENSYEELISQHIDDDNPGNTGIVLVGEGQRGYRKNKYLKGLKEDSMFRNRIKTKLAESYHLNENKIKTGWFNYIEPNYMDSINTILEYNLGKVLIIYTKPSVTNIENIIITQKIRSRPDIPEGVKVLIIDGFLKDSKFINELKNRIEFTNFQKWE
ncbi:ferrochelatase [Proteiniborus ethanoligenes]|uniref:Ferrochelatase n=2 Tax=Proteiniborus ethanoligenes TaxID=415015 RepID=A0A1H3JV03_9FIRM|nr:ferrochelatase [Proteiniborus ethanoligenes]